MSKPRTLLVALGSVLVTAAALAAWLTQRSAQSATVPTRTTVSPALASERPPAARPAAAQPVAQPNAQPAQRATAAPQAAADLPPGQALREVQALVAQAKIGAARDLAESYLKRIPDGPEAAQIKSLTGVHPHP